MDEGLVLVGELARRCGVTSRTLRVYERRGIIAPVERGSNGYRFFDSSIEPTILIVGSLLSLGLSLNEVARNLRRLSADSSGTILGGDAGDHGSRQSRLRAAYRGH